MLGAWLRKGEGNDGDLHGTGGDENKKGDNGTGITKEDKKKMTDRSDVDKMWSDIYNNDNDAFCSMVQVWAGIVRWG